MTSSVKDMASFLLRCGLFPNIVSVDIIATYTSRASLDSPLDARPSLITLIVPLFSRGASVRGEEGNNLLYHLWYVGATGSFPLEGHRLLQFLLLNQPLDIPLENVTPLVGQKKSVANIAWKPRSEHEHKMVVIVCLAQEQRLMLLDVLEGVAFTHIIGYDLSRHVTRDDDRNHFRRKRVLSLVT